MKSGAKGLALEGKASLVQRVAEVVGDSTERHIDRLAWSVGWRNTVRLALASVTLFVAEYVFGRMD